MLAYPIASELEGVTATRCYLLIIQMRSLRPREWGALPQVTLTHSLEFVLCLVSHSSFPTALTKETTELGNYHGLRCKDAVFL